jgi:hypothetical protein
MSYIAIKRPLQVFAAHVLASSVLWLFMVQVIFAQDCTDESVCLVDPLGFTSVNDFVTRVLKAFITLAIPVISFFIIWAGFKYVMARGKPNAIAEAHKNFWYLILGSILLLGALALSQLIGRTIEEIRGV